MTTPHEVSQKVQKVQGQALATARKAQDVVVETVTALTVIAHAIPGYDKFIEQFPTADQFVDSNFDFAQQILRSQRDFAGRIVAATAAKPTTSVAVAKVAPKAIAPAPATTPAPKKATAPAKKSVSAKAVSAKAVSAKTTAPRTITPK